MDFWARLVAGTSLASAGKKGSSNTPKKRLARFKREYSQLLQTWRNTSNLSRDYEASENIHDSLQKLTAILGDESRRPLPHPCIACASAQQIYIPIGKICTTSHNEAIIREGVALFATLIDSEEEEFVENDAFSKSLMNLLVRITGANSIRLGLDTEVQIVELAFNITTKIRLEPEILPAWFTAQHVDTSSSGQDAHEKFTGKTHKEEFPLFYLLIDYIHHEGRIGDFARTGLLYIIEAASNSVALEQWIVESDLATLMATGLGALYSQLSRKLVIDYLPDGLPLVLAFSDYQHPNSTSEIVGSASPDFQGHMETFLSHLVFWQDVLNHCKSIEVKSTLLEHFQVIFLQQLLYPSLLESSDVDGGSSVAVLTYLRRILESLDHPDMIHLILHYLLALPDVTPTSSASRGSISAARKRKSMDLATMMAGHSHDELPTTPALFNLVDLIHGSLRSQSQQTISVTLQLVSVIVKRHHRYAVTTLLRTSQILSEGPRRTVGAHEKVMDLLLTLAGNLGGDENFDDIYENHLHDCMSVLESHMCSITLIAPKSAGGTTKFPGSQATIPGALRDIRSHTLRPEDPMLETLLGILKTWFTNSVDINLSLTGTIVDLSTCGFTHIDGWLLPDPSKYIYEEEATSNSETSEDLSTHDDPLIQQEKAQLLALKKARRPINLTTTPLPAILTILKFLLDQVTTYRNTIPRFTDLLQQRREAFQTTSVPSHPATHTHTPSIRPTPPRSTVSSSRTSSPPRPSAFDNLAHRIFPDLPSRSHSPRGRKSQEQQQQNSSSTLSGGYGTATPTAANTRNPPPAQFPMNIDTTPSRGSSRASDGAAAEEKLLRNKGVPASQAAAFAAVDQSILAKKVGLTSIAKGGGWEEAIPFPNLRASSLIDAKKGGEGEGIEDSGKITEEVMKEIGEGGKGEGKEVTVSHVLTNVLVLQEFLLELAALVQVRAGLLGEIKFV